MTNKKFLISSIVVTLTISCGITAGQIMSQSVKTFEATRVVEFYAPETSAPWLVQTEIVGVRNDGSSVMARKTLHPTTGADVYLRRVTDVSNKKMVVVNPLTESLTTYPLGKTIERERIKPTTGCPGEPAGEMLGYPVTLERKRTDSDGVQTNLQAWRSPALDCVPMREESRLVKDGVESVKVSKITGIVQGQPEEWLFDIPSTYAEKTPTEVFVEQARRYPQRFRTPHASASNLDVVYGAAQERK
jgi:hypothetical protein